MTLSGHAHSDRQRYDIIDMACRVTRERALNVAERCESRFLVRRVQARGMILNWF